MRNSITDLALNFECFKASQYFKTETGREMWPKLKLATKQANQKSNFNGVSPSDFTSFNIPISDLGTQPHFNFSLLGLEEEERAPTELKR